MRGYVRSYEYLAFALVAAGVLAGCESKPAAVPPSLKAPATTPTPASAGVDEGTPLAQTAQQSGTQSSKVLLGSADLTSGISGKGPLKLAEIEVWLKNPRNMEPLDFELPLGLAAGAGQVKGID